MMRYESSQGMLTAAWILLALSFLFVGLRLYVRVQSRPRLLGADDKILMIALLLYLIQVAILADVMHFTHNGTYFTVHNATRACVYAWLLHLLYAQIIWCAKLSLFLLYRRLLSGLCMQKQLKATAVLLVFSWLVVTILYAIPLRSFSAGDPRDRTQYTVLEQLHATLETYCVGPLDVLTSVILTLLPFALLRRLRIDAKDKTALLLIFSLGLLCISASICRWIVLLEISTASIFILWSNLEQSCLLIVQSLMVLRPLLYQILDLVGIDTCDQYRNVLHYPFSKRNPSKTQGRYLSSSRGRSKVKSLEDMHDDMILRSTPAKYSRTLKYDAAAHCLTTTTIKTDDPDVICPQHDAIIDFGEFETESYTVRPSWAAIQVEQSFTHSFEHICLHGLCHYNRTEVYAGGKRPLPKHPVKAKSLSSISHNGIHSKPLRHAVTFSEVQHGMQSMEAEPDVLKLVP